MYVVRSFLRDSSTEMCKDLVLFPVYASCCLISARPPFESLVYCVPRVRSACQVDGRVRAHLRRDDHLVPNPARLHPLANEHLRRLVLVVVRGIDEVSPRGVERVEQRETRLLAHRAHSRTPLVADAHSSEAEWRHVQAGIRRERTVAAKLGCWLRWWSPGHVDKKLASEWS